MTDYARRERAALADLLTAAGPDAPTLCAGWSTRDLAAHLVVRDRRPDVLAGIVVPALGGYTERVRRAAAARSYEGLVAAVRTPPWWSPVGNPLVHEPVNTVEYYVHHEDVRRAAAGWEPRELPEGEQHALWRALRLTARLGLRRLGLPLLVRAPGAGELRVGTGGPAAVLEGAPGELLLFATGRQAAARVRVEASAEVTDRLRTARLGL